MHILPAANHKSHRDNPALKHIKELKHASKSCVSLLLKCSLGCELSTAPPKQCRWDSQAHPLVILPGELNSESCPTLSIQFL